MIKGSIEITGQHLMVVPMISDSFLFEASDKSSHVATINLNSKGSSVLKIDGSEFSAYCLEAKKNTAYRQKLNGLYRKLAIAYEMVSDSYLNMYKDVDAVISYNLLMEEVNSLSLERYQPIKFELPYPEEKDIEFDLIKEAENGNEDVNIFLLKNNEKALTYRRMKWEEIKEYHNYIFDYIESKENKKNLELYNYKKQHFSNILAGEESYVKAEIESIAKRIKIPFSTKMDYMYDQKTGILDLDIYAPVRILVPDSKAIIKTNGTLVIEKLNKKEIEYNETRSLLSSSFYIAWSLWNISTSIKTIRITTWSFKNEHGLCWYEFPRDNFANLKPNNFDVVLVSENFKHVFMIENLKLKPIYETEFKLSILKGKYEIESLHDFSSQIKRIGEEPAENCIVAKEDFSAEAKMLASEYSINAEDGNYDMTSPPYYNESFKNFTYQLLGKSHCSLKMFVEEFHMTLSHAKEMMKILVQSGLVGNKDDLGSRRIVYSTENELEFRLSWIFPNL